MPKKRTRQEVETRFVSKDEMTPDTKKASKGLADFAKRFAPVAAGLAAVVAGGAAFVAMYRKTIDVLKVSIRTTTDQSVALSQLSDALGIGTEAMQGFSFAGEKVGVSGENLGLAIQRMTRRIGEAAKGGGEAKSTLEELNLPIADLAEMAPEEQFFKIAEAMEGVKGQSKKLATAFKFFDSEGARPVLAILKQGTAGLEDQLKRARELGGVYDKDLIRKSLEFKATQVELRTAVRGVGAVIAGEFLPVATKAVKAVTDFVVDNKEAVRDAAESLARQFDDALGKVTEFLKDDGPAFVEMLTAWAEIAGTTTKMVVDVTSSAVKVVNFLIDLGREDKNLVAGVEVDLDEESLTAAEERMAELSRKAAETFLANVGAAVQQSFGPIDVTKPDFPGLDIPQPPPVVVPITDIEQPTVNPIFEEEGFGEFAGIPTEEAMALAEERFGELNGLIEEWGATAVEKTLEISKAISDIGDQAKRTFIVDFGKSMQAMGRSVSLAIANNLGNLKGFKDSATQIWRDFVNQTIAMLIRLIAKLLIAAGLQAFLGFGNFAAVSRLGQVIGVLKVPTGEGKQFGGIVKRRRTGLGDTILTPTSPGEGVITRPAVNRLGRSNLAMLNAGASAMGGPGDMALLGARSVVVIEAHVRTIFGSRDEGLEVARGVFQYADELGFAGGSR